MHVNAYDLAAGDVGHGSKGLGDLVDCRYPIALILWSVRLREKHRDRLLDALATRVLGVDNNVMADSVGGEYSETTEAVARDIGSGPYRERVARSCFAAP